MSIWAEMSAVERRESVARLHREGRKHREIAEELGTTRHAVSGVLYRLANGPGTYVPAPGSAGRRPPPPPEHKITEAAYPVFRAMWARGIQMKAMARRFNCSIGCIDDTRVRLGLPKREAVKGRRHVSSYLEHENYELLSKRAFDEGVSIAMVVRVILLDALKPKP